MSQDEPVVFGGRYQLERHLARGGMSEVYVARDLRLDRRVALKVLFRELSTDRAFVERFRREAQAAANLSHPHIVSVFDWGEEDGSYFIVMEFVDGRSLSGMLRSQGPMLADRAAEIGADVAAALAAAHRNGVVHRDVKPGNVLLDSAGNVKVADFGIARAVNTQDDLTQTGAVMGTATYFSPEQAQGFPVDARSDVYSLGIVLYELVTGRVPFTGDTPVAIAYKHVREEPVPPRAVDPNIPEAFERIVLKALAKDPDLRYASADDLRADLLRFRQGRAVLAEAPVVQRTQAVTQVVEPTQVHRAYERTPGAVAPVAPARGGNGIYVALLVVLLAVLAGLFYLLGREIGLFGGGAGGADTVEVPNVVGQPLEEARATLTTAGFQVEQQLEANEAPEGQVFAQEPEAGELRPTGETVLLRVSQGAPPVEVPDVVGQDVEDARRALEAAGLQVAVETRPDSDTEAGEVLSQDPRGGSEAERGSQVRLLVSGGRERVVVPDVTGKDQAAASNELGRAGLSVQVRREPSDTVAEGRVIRTDPRAGTEVEKDSDVTMFVSTGPEDVEVPDVVGMTENDATNRLRSAGFRVEAQETRTSNPEEMGRVVSQSPGARSRAAKGSTVVIRVARVLQGE